MAAHSAQNSENRRFNRRVCFSGSSSLKRRMFKQPLIDHLSMTGRTISSVIELCVCALLERGLHEEGLLRVGCGEFIVLLCAVFVNAIGEDNNVR